MANRFCQKCGAELRENGMFCSKCGYTIQPEVQTAPQEGCCTKCGAKLREGASFCSRCREPVSKALNVQAALSGFGDVSRSVTENVQSAARNTAQGLSSYAPAQAGDISISLPSLEGAASRVVSRRFGIANVLAGLGGGGISCAALWNVDHPMLISGGIAAAMVAVRVAAALIRRRS